MTRALSRMAAGLIGSLIGGLLGAALGAATDSGDDFGLWPYYIAFYGMVLGGSLAVELGEGLAGRRPRSTWKWDRSAGVWFGLLIVPALLVAVGLAFGAFEGHGWIPIAAAVMIAALVSGRLADKDSWITPPGPTHGPSKHD